MMYRKVAVPGRLGVSDMLAWSPEASALLSFDDPRLWTSVSPSAAPTPASKLLIRCLVWHRSVLRCYRRTSAPRPPTQRWGSLRFECVLFVIVSGTLELDGFLPSL
jgi:hypothetical protein